MNGWVVLGAIALVALGLLLSAKEIRVEVAAKPPRRDVGPLVTAYGRSIPVDVQQAMMLAPSFEVARKRLADHITAEIDAARRRGHHEYAEGLKHASYRVMAVK